MFVVVVVHFLFLFFSFFFLFLLVFFFFFLFCPSNSLKKKKKKIGRRIVLSEYTLSTIYIKIFKPLSFPFKFFHFKVCFFFSLSQFSGNVDDVEYFPERGSLCELLVVASSLQSINPFHVCPSNHSSLYTHTQVITQLFTILKTQSKSLISASMFSSNLQTLSN